MIQLREFGKLSNILFLLGFIVSKIQYIPIAIISSVVNIIALGCYFLAYGAWFVSSHFQPNHKNNENEWYGFSQFKEQFLYAAAIGLAATLISLSAIYFPVLIVPASWLFFSSNVFWTIGEYNKLQDPPKSDEHYSHSGQNSYVAYAITTTATGLTSALSATLILIFPPLTVPVVIISTIISIGLGVLATEYWLDYTFGNHNDTPILAQSYDQMSKSLTEAKQLDQELSAQPYHENELFKRPRNNSPQHKDKEFESDFTNQSFTLSQ
ncbi:MAG: hypothetical protein M1486_00440 [Gammaproteobacteria bacterium]|nr:hypothetical protein [Gammaproteobacteria bacterium]